MYLALKILHIAAMTLWFSGLFFLPALMVARLRMPDGEPPSDEEEKRFDAFGRTLYFGITTPAGLVTVFAGTVLMLYGPFGGWLVLKLVLVCGAVLMHLYLGVVMHEYARGRPRHGVAFFRMLACVPLLIVLGIAALTGAKPASVDSLPPPPGIDGT